MASHSTRLPRLIRDIETKVMSSLISVTLPVLSAVGLVLEDAITSHEAREIKTVHLDIADLLAVAESQGIDIIPMLKKSGLSVSSGVDGVSCTFNPSPYTRFALIRAHNLVRMKIETFSESFVPFVPSPMPSLSGCVSTMDVSDTTDKLWKIMSVDELKDPNPIKCMCGGFDALCVWGSEAQPAYYCLGCQEA